MNITNAVRTQFDPETVRVQDDAGGEYFMGADNPDLQEWAGAGGVIADFEPPPAAPVETVSSRQFKLQLLAAGLLDQVDAWIATQSKAVQIAYEYSGSFVRSEPMMASGFAAMGFTDAQIDAFFEAASKL